MKKGGAVRVRNLDGETAEGEFVEAYDATVDEWEIPYVDHDGATLMDYWRGTDVEPDEAVLCIELEGSCYDYPESRVEVIEDG